MVDFDFIKVIAEPLINYGPLGIIGLIFLRNQINVQRSASEHFDKLFDAMTARREQSIDDIKRSVLSLSEALQAHNLNSQKAIAKLDVKLQRFIDIRVASKEVFDDVLQEHKKSIAEIQQCSTALRMQLSRMKELTLGLKDNEDEIVEEMINQGLITRQQVSQIVSKLAAKEIHEEGIICTTPNLTPMCIQTITDAPEQRALMPSGEPETKPE